MQCLAVALTEGPLNGRQRRSIPQATALVAAYKDSVTCVADYCSTGSLEIRADKLEQCSMRHGLSYVLYPPSVLDLYTVRGELFLSLLLNPVAA